MMMTLTQFTCSSTVDPQKAPDKPQDLTIYFEKGLPVKVTSDRQEWTDTLELFIALNAIGKKHGVGRIDIVENRYVGIKSRGCYDSPAMTIVGPTHAELSTNMC